MGGLAALLLLWFTVWRKTAASALSAMPTSAVLLLLMFAAAAHALPAVAFVAHVEEMMLLVYILPNVTQLIFFSILSIYLQTLVKSIPRTVWVAF